MADDPFEAFRLSLMQDVLPVGIAMVERVQKGGLAKVSEVFDESNNPWQALRCEGEPAAKTLREQLDNVSPGLGNPVVSVKVDVEEEKFQANEISNQDPLMQCLGRIDSNIKAMEDLLSNSGDGFSSSLD